MTTASPSKFFTRIRSIDWETKKKAPVRLLAVDWARLLDMEENAFADFMFTLSRTGGSGVDVSALVASIPMTVSANPIHVPTMIMCVQKERVEEMQRSVPSPGYPDRALLQRIVKWWPKEVGKTGGEMLVREDKLSRRRYHVTLQKKLEKEVPQGEGGPDATKKKVSDRFVAICEFQCVFQSITLAQAAADEVR